MPLSNPSLSYFEQTVPIRVNISQTLTNTAANKTFISSNDRGAVGLISSDDNQVQKVMLLVVGVVANSYAGSNALDCTTASHNQWQIAPNGSTTWSDLVNGTNDDGQMIDNDWLCGVEGASTAFTLMFDVTSQVTDVDGNIGVRLSNGRSEESSLVVTANIFLKVLWCI